MVIKIFNDLWAKDLGIVEMFRGDSLELILDIRDGSAMVNDKYLISSNDTIYFALMEVNQKFENAILKKVYTVENIDSEGNIKIKIFPSDTSSLLPGKYYYTIKMRHMNDNNNDPYDVYTLCKKTEFWLID